MPAGEPSAQLDTTRFASLPLNLVTVCAAEAGVASSPMLTAANPKAAARAFHMAVPLSSDRFRESRRPTVGVCANRTIIGIASRMVSPLFHVFAHAERES